MQRNRFQNEMGQVEKQWYDYLCLNKLRKTQKLDKFRYSNFKLDETQIVEALAIINVPHVILVVLAKLINEPKSLYEIIYMGECLNYHQCSHDQNFQKKIVKGKILWTCSMVSDWEMHIT